jgi:hypothetical protein
VIYRKARFIFPQFFTLRTVHGL